MEQVIKKVNKYQVNGFVPKALVEMLLDESYALGIHEAWKTVFKSQDYMAGLTALDELKRGSVEPQESL